ncbi:MAG: hypothetical protein ABIH09_04095, partial [Candidatus Omnitrophota bacterium]
MFGSASNFWEKIILPKTKAGYITKTLKKKKLSRNNAVMFGDTTSDAKNAKKVGVNFIGRAHDEEKEKDLLSENAKLVIRDYKEENELLKKIEGFLPEYVQDAEDNNTTGFWGKSKKLIKSIIKKMFIILFIAGISEAGQKAGVANNYFSALVNMWLYVIVFGLIAYFLYGREISLRLKADLVSKDFKLKVAQLSAIIFTASLVLIKKEVNIFNVAHLFLIGTCSYLAISAIQWVRRAVISHRARDIIKKSAGDKGHDPEKWVFYNEIKTPLDAIEFFIYALVIAFISFCVVNLVFCRIIERNAFLQLKNIPNAIKITLAAAVNFINGAMLAKLIPYYQVKEKLSANRFLSRKNKNILKTLKNLSLQRRKQIMESLPEILDKIENKGSVYGKVIVISQKNRRLNFNLFFQKNVLKELMHRGIEEDMAQILIALVQEVVKRKQLIQKETILAVLREVKRSLRENENKVKKKTLISILLGFFMLRHSISEAGIVGKFIKPLPGFPGVGIILMAAAFVSLISIMYLVFKSSTSESYKKDRLGTAGNSKKLSIVLILAVLTIFGITYLSYRSKRDIDFSQQKEFSQTIQEPKELSEGKNGKPTIIVPPVKPKHKVFKEYDLSDEENSFRQDKYGRVLKEITSDGVIVEFVYFDDPNIMHPYQILKKYDPELNKRNKYGELVSSIMEEYNERGEMMKYEEKGVLSDGNIWSRRYNSISSKKSSYFLRNPGNDNLLLQSHYGENGVVYESIDFGEDGIMDMKRDYNDETGKLEYVTGFLYFSDGTSQILKYDLVNRQGDILSKTEKFKDKSEIQTDYFAEGIYYEREYGPNGVLFEIRKFNPDGKMIHKETYFEDWGKYDDELFYYEWGEEPDDLEKENLSGEDDFNDIYSTTKRLPGGQFKSRIFVSMLLGVFLSVPSIVGAGVRKGILDPVAYSPGIGIILMAVSSILLITVMFLAFNKPENENIKSLINKRQKTKFLLFGNKGTLAKLSFLFIPLAIFIVSVPFVGKKGMTEQYANREGVVLKEQIFQKDTLMPGERTISPETISKQKRKNVAENKKRLNIDNDNAVLDDFFDDCGRPLEGLSAEGVPENYIYFQDCNIPYPYYVSREYDPSYDAQGNLLKSVTSIAERYDKEGNLIQWEYYGVFPDESRWQYGTDLKNMIIWYEESWKDTGNNRKFMRYNENSFFPEIINYDEEGHLVDESDGYGRMRYETLEDGSTVKNTYPEGRFTPHPKRQVVTGDSGQGIQIYDVNPDTGEVKKETQRNYDERYSYIGHVTRDVRTGKIIEIVDKNKDGWSKIRYLEDGSSVEIDYELGWAIREMRKIDPDGKCVDGQNYEHEEKVRFADDNLLKKWGILADDDGFFSIKTA